MLALRPAARRSSSRNEIPMRTSSPANRARGGLPNCASVSPHTPTAWSAGLPTRPSLKKKPHSTLRWWTCRAAGPARWAAILRFAIVCNWRICRGLPNASAAFCARLCAPSVPAAAWSTRPVRWSRRKMSRSWLRSSLKIQMCGRFRSRRPSRRCNAMAFSALRRRSSCEDASRRTAHCAYCLAHCRLTASLWLCLKGSA